MLDKLKSLEKRFATVSELISDSEVIADRDRWRDLCREHSELSPIIDEYNRYKSYLGTIEDDKALMEVEEDKELLEMLKADLAEAEKNAEKSEEEIKLLLIPKDPNDDRNVIMESAAVQAVRKRHFSQALLCVCIRCMRIKRVGNWKY